MALVGIVLAVWSASGYVAVFIRAANAVYDMPEGRPVWKILPVRVGVTVVLMVLAVVSALIVVFTGPLARQAGSALGIGDMALTVWSIAKWPVLVVLVTIMIAILYWASPNAKVKGFRWITPGSFLALVIWMIASAAFAFYVANFASYNKTYGTMAGVAVDHQPGHPAGPGVRRGDRTPTGHRRRPAARHRALHPAPRHPKVGRGRPPPPGRRVNRRPRS